jgi:hypothetical protein
MCSWHNILTTAILRPYSTVIRGNWCIPSQWFIHSLIISQLRKESTAYIISQMTSPIARGGFCLMDEKMWSHPLFRGSLFSAFEEFTKIWNIPFIKPSSHLDTHSYGSSLPEHYITLKPKIPKIPKMPTATARILNGVRCVGKIIMKTRKNQQETCNKKWTKKGVECGCGFSNLSEFYST